MSIIKAKVLCETGFKDEKNYWKELCFNLSDVAVIQQEHDDNNVLVPEHCEVLFRTSVPKDSFFVIDIPYQEMKAKFMK